MTSQKRAAFADAVREFTTADDARWAFSLLRQRVRALETTEASMFGRGDIVQFKRRHVTVRGTVTKVNSRTVTVMEADGQLWRVAPSLLVRVA